MALIFYCLHVALSVWAVCVVEGEYVEIACFQTLMPIDTFFLMSKTSEEAKYLHDHVRSQIALFSCLCYVLPTIYFLQCFKKKTEKAIETVATESV